MMNKQKNPEAAVSAESVTGRKKQSFFQQSSRLFIGLIVFPTLLCWICYILFLNVHFTLRSLETQQLGLQNQLEQTENTMKGINDGIVHMLESNSEMTYYLNGLYDGPDMVYTIMKNIRPLWDSICSCYPAVSEFHIYTDADVMLFETFRDVDSLPLSDTERENLYGSLFREILWKVDTSADGYPIFSSYQKVYNQSYSQCIGYLEICYNSGFFQNMSEVLRDMLYDSHAGYFCVYDGKEIYRSSDTAQEAVKIPEEDGVRLFWQSDTYCNALTLNGCNLRIIFTGKLFPTVFHSSDTFPILMISLLILLLLFCFFCFFKVIRRLSEKIYAFSSFLDKSAEGNLKEYQLSSEEKFAEIDTLVRSYNDLVHKNRILNERMMHMEALTQEARYQALQSQIHPHFIYGTLETIRMLAMANQDMDTASMIYSLSSLMRQSVEITSHASTLEKELSIVQDYMDIQQIRFSGALRYDVNADSSLLDLKLPPFTLQPIVENAIVYGISQTLDPGEILIRISRQVKGNTVCISISNTGNPMEPERLREINSLLAGLTVPEAIRTQGNGIALNNILKRLQFLYPDRIDMKIEAEDIWTRVIIMIQETA